MIQYFAYGSNMNLKQIRERTHNHNLQPIFIGYMKDKKLIFPRKSMNWEGGVASYGGSDGDNLWGAVFLLTDDELKEIDRCEGYYGPKRSNTYERVEEEIIKEDETPIKIITYIANKLGDFLPSKKYMEQIIKGAEDCKLPKEYITKLNAISYHRNLQQS